MSYFMKDESSVDHPVEETPRPETEMQEDFGSKELDVYINACDRLYL